MLAFGPMLLVCLSIVLAAPAATLAATGGDTRCEDSRAAQALAGDFSSDSSASEGGARDNDEEPVGEPDSAGAADDGG